MKIVELNPAVVVCDSGLDWARDVGVDDRSLRMTWVIVDGGRSMRFSSERVAEYAKEWWRVCVSAP